MVREIVLPMIFPLGMVVLGCLAACDDARPPLVQDDSTAQLFNRADPERGRVLIAEKGCVACHVVPGVNSNAASPVGPPLKHVGRQAYLGGVLPNTSPNLVRWLMDPPAINPRTAMPNVGLSANEAEDIAAFLITSR